MADEFDDDIEFGDIVDLDDLPADALDKIEERAIASTQQNNTRYVDEFGGAEDDDVIDLNYYGQPQAQQFVQPQPAHQQDEVNAREQWRQQRYGGAPQQKPNETWKNWHDVTYSQVPQAGPGQPTAQGQAQPQESDQQSYVDIGALQARIADLERQQAVIQKTAEDARAAYLSKAGEISIVRANHDKASKEYERRLAVMHQLHSEEVTKQRAELDRMKRDKDKVETDNRFLQHDLAQEAEKAKSMKRTLAVRPVTAPRPVQHTTPMSTPKKDKTVATFRDGFDDDEVLVVSPTKAKDKMKATTPKRTKRKRNAVLEPDNSPGMSLPLVMDDSPMRHIEQEAISPPRPLVQTTVTDASTKKFETMQMILNHRADGKAKRTMELLADFPLPTTRGVSISTSIYDDLARHPLKQSDDEFRYAFSILLMNRWSECMEHEYYDPLNCLSSLLTYLLLESEEVLSTSLIPQLTPLCLKTTDLIGIPVAKFNARSVSAEPLPSATLTKLINPANYLHLLHLVAFNCLSNDEDLASLWSLMDFDFILVMLNKGHPIAHITQMLHLLSTSILPDTFGAIAVRNEQSSITLSERQARNESATIHRLIFLLFEPVTVEGLLAVATNSQIIPSDSTALPCMRTQVLTLLTELAHTPHGGQLLATHPVAFGRLVRFLHDAILNMYNYCPEPDLSDDSSGSTTLRTPHDHHTAHVNLTVLLLAHLTDVPISTPNAITTTRLDVRAKLATTPGGPEKHLVSLSRIAFADGLTSIEKGILPETADAAHRMLDELLSPEEGEAVMMVFGGGG